ncbi:hypothetical protein ACFOEE_04695 [Pseudoalteromonas fenneropenaei]|uniref:SPOR domain-containing protein n=1 Tax=Pseudoalteromonas fenneropenaei TaxID=1737459 RepID=A0ABV7CH20_9GAMM
MSDLSMRFVAVIVVMTYTLLLSSCSTIDIANETEAQPDAELQQQTVVELLSLKQDLQVILDELHYQTELQNGVLAHVTEPKIKQYQATSTAYSEPETQTLVNGTTFATVTSEFQVYLGIYASEQRALQHWQTLQKQLNPELANLSTSITSAPLNPAFFSIRFNQLMPKHHAEQLCAALQQRSFSCVARANSSKALL